MKKSLISVASELLRKYLFMTISHKENDALLIKYDDFYCVVEN
jgi:hypothetical protein